MVDSEHLMVIQVTPPVWGGCAPSQVRFMPEWWNWYTREFQKLLIFIIVGSNPTSSTILKIFG